MKNIKTFKSFNEGLDPLGSWDHKKSSNSFDGVYNKILEYLYEKDFDLYDGEESFKEKCLSILNSDKTNREKSIEIT